MIWKTSSLQLILGYISHEMPYRAIDLFSKIENPDKTIDKLYFNACAQLANKEASNRAEIDLVNAVLMMFLKCDQIHRAQTLF